MNRAAVPEAGSGAHGPRRGLLDWLGALAIAWLMLGAGELLLARAVPRSTLNSAMLPAPIKRTLMADELLGLAAAVLVVGLLLYLASRLWWRLAGERTACRRLGNVLLFAVVWCLMLFFTGSWSVFRSTGAFLAPDGLAFFGANLVQFTQHVAHQEPRVLVGLPVAVTVATAVLFLLVLLTSQPRAWRWRWAVAVATVFGLVVSAWLSWTGPRFRGFELSAFADPRVGTVYTAGDLYRDCRDNRTGPVRYLWAYQRDRWWSDSTPLRPSPSLEVEWRPLLSVDAWRDRVDTSQQRRLNVLLVLIESLRSDQLTAFGGSRVVMPGVEAVAAEGRAFVNHYTQSSHSNYADLCALNSQYPLRSRTPHVYPQKPSYPRLLIYDLLRGLDYRTAIISSQNENWGGMLNYLQTGGLDYLLHAGNYQGPTYVPRGDAGFVDFLKGDKPSGKIDDRYTIDEAIRWIGEGGESPFFIYLNLQNSHLPYETPADFPRRFGTGKLPFVVRFNDYPPEFAHLVKDEYADSLAYVDHQLGRLLDFLRQSRLWEETVIVISGDTGQAFYEHGFAAHANMLFNEVLRVPLILRAPELEPGRDLRPSQHVDIPPTVLDLLGLPAHPGFQGSSLLGPLPPEPRSLFLVAQCPLAEQVAVVRDGFKLIHDLRRRQRWLFDLRADPGELQPVQDRPELVEELSRYLDTFHYHQLRYYRDLGLQSSVYPPFFSD